jgi:multidrug efflux system outer membrane protein
MGLAAFVLLTGCTVVGPDYRRPEISLPASYPEPTDPGASANAVPADWWVLYRDPRLNGLVEAGLVRNADVRLAAARIEEAAAVVRQARASEAPSVDGDASAGRSRTSTRLGGMSQGPVVRNNFRIAASTSFELDFWGRLQRLREAAGAEYLATRYGRDAVMQSLAAAIAQMYFTVLSLDAQVQTSAETLSAAEDSAQIVRARADAGLVSDLDVNQAEANRASLAAQIKELRRQRAAAVHQLGVLTGNLDLQLEAGDIRSLPTPPLPPAGLPSALLERRADVRRSEAAVVAANARIGVARAAQFPTLSLTAALGAQSAALGNLLASGAGIWSFGLGVVGPIFDAGLYAARTEQAEAQARQTAIEYEQTVETAFREVADALSNIRLAAEAEQDLVEQVAQAANSLKLATLRYEAGYSAYIEVLDARRTLNVWQLALLRNRQNYLAYTVDLINALGGGWTAY